MIDVIGKLLKVFMILPKRSLVKHLVVLMFSRFDAPANTQLGMCIFLTLFKGGGGQTHVEKIQIS